MKKGLDTEHIKGIFDEILAERKRQHEKWGLQDFPMVYETRDGWVKLLEEMRAVNERKELAWESILMEEVSEAFVETDSKKACVELIQSAAIIVQIIECHYRKEGK